MNKIMFLVVSLVAMLLLIAPLSLGAVSLTNVSYYKFDNTLEDFFFNIGELTSFVQAEEYNTTNLSISPTLVVKDDTHFYEIDNITDGHISRIRTVDFWVKEPEISSGEYYIGFGKEPTDQNLFRLLNTANKYGAVMVKGNTVIWSITTSSMPCNIQTNKRKNVIILFESNTTASLYVDTEFCGRTTIGGNVFPDGDWDHIIINGRLDHAAGVMGAYEIDNLILSETLYTGDDINASYNAGLGLELGLPPGIINSSWNVTFDPFVNAITTNWNTGDQVNFSFGVISDAVVTLTVDTDQTTNMTCSLTEGNYSEMVADPLHKSVTTETTAHSYTISDNFTSQGQDCIYCSFIDVDGTMETESGISQSGCLDVFINTQPINNTILTPITGNNISGLSLIDWLSFTDINLVLYEVLVIESVSNNITFIGNTSSAVTELNFNFSSLVIDNIYNLTVRGYDSYNAIGLSYNQRITIANVQAKGQFFNMSLFEFANNNTLDEDSPWNFSFTTFGSDNLNFSGLCNLHINDVNTANLTPVFGNNTFFSIPLLAGNHSFNVSCATGNDALNSPQFFSLNVTPTPPPANITNVFNAVKCPSTLPQIILYIFFVLVFFGLYVYGMATFRVIALLSSIMLIMISVSSFICIGVLFSAFLTTISVILGIVAIASD